MDKIGTHPKMIGRVQTLEQKVLASLFLLGNKTSYIVASDKYHMSRGSLYLTLKNFCQVGKMIKRFSHLLFEVSYDSSNIREHYKN